MTVYIPDCWSVLKVKGSDEIVYKILAGWSGGYTTGDSWQLNSGIVSVELEGEHYIFHGYSGSEYRCHTETYRLNMITASMLNQWQHAHGEDVVQLLDDRPNWHEFDFGG